MARRVTLPGADELFRSTDGHDDAAATARVDGGRDADEESVGEQVRVAPRHGATGRAGRRPQPTGRERHDEKITVYVSADELYDLERARLVLRGEHGVAVDRGRLVREALAVVLTDLDAKGAASILVRRLRGS